jgi:hypothetical protein
MKWIETSLVIAGTSLVIAGTSLTLGSALGSVMVWASDAIGATNINKEK